MSAHTPGPWHVGDITFAEVPTHDGSRKGRLAASIHHSESRFTMIRVGARSDHQEEVLANARLVAAAWEMLENGKALVDRDCTYDGGNIIIPCGSHAEALRIMQEFRSSLARAEGRQP